ncbi:ATP-binding protein [Allomesorhizobium alhagi]|uniref:histidine kinase n=1 Tax=Mesorhizobium alhagi CCNWXJ12-2 TaxID=1107882 RepID=H0I1N2_9HYPH|nr:ATP-binding protein [Mesorhizobium alhagi]EHK53096.1 pas sensor protein [Mesorhizobium alhagi CCNWXJ12-2]
MMSVINMIESAAVVILAVLFLAFLGDRLERSFWTKSIVFGIVFGATGVISMATPVEFAPGFFADGRNVVMAFSGAIGGPVSAIITAAMLSGMRMNLGGAGLATALAGIWLVAAGSSAMWGWLRARGHQRLDTKSVLILAMLAALLPPLALVMFGDAPSDEVLRNLVALVVPTNFIGVLLLGFLIINDHQRRWAVSAYAESQAQLQAIANNAPGVLFQLSIGSDGIGVFSYVSGGAERVLGVAAEDIVGKPGTVSRMISRETLAEVERQLKLSAETREAWSMEAEFTKPNREKVWMRVAAEPRIDVNGELVWDGSLFDITERKRSEQMKNDFISTVSHELRTPLTSIRGSLGLVAAGAAGEIPPKVAGLIKIAHSNSERLVRLINDILDIEKIESGRMPFDPRPMALRPLVEQAIEGSGNYLAERNVSIIVDDEAPGALTAVDPDRLHQVMLNLLSNAIKYSPQDGRVTVRLARQEGMIRVSVIDQGPGIPLAFQSRIFGKFEQADSSDSRQKGGTGLGLSIVKAIVDRLGGGVSFDTGPETGTSFHVDLPEASDRRSRHRETVSKEGESSPPRVLIVEDEPDIADLIAFTLAQKGIQSDIAPDIESAKDLLASNRYVAMTLDIKLAGQSGLTLYEDLRTTANGRDLPVIVVSAFTDEARKSLNGSALGIVDWLEKPIDMERLRTAIEKVRKGAFRRMPTVLHVEDDEGVLEVISAGLGDDIAMTFARNVQEARFELQRKHFDVVILDLTLPDGSGAELLGAIPSDTVVVIFSASEVNEHLAAQVQHALTKTKTSEIAIAELVRKLTAMQPGNESPSKTKA